MLPAGGVDNVLLLTDSYKVTHWKQYPPGTSHIYSYFESRGGKFDRVCFFGLQYILKRWFVGSVLTEEKIAEAKDIYDQHLGPGFFNEEGFRYILTEHKGRLPLRIKAVPEGMVVPTKNVLFTIENTDPKCFWLTNYFETIFVQCWYPMTVCTLSRSMKELLANALAQTSESLDGLTFKLHDFGYRGATSVESGGIGGCANLVNFRGSDTIAALATARKYYHCNMAGFSIPAAEHSTITSWGKEHEADAYRNILMQFPSGTVACVSDSYDIFNACEKVWGEELHAEVLKRDGRGVLVVRPDSGDPATVVIKVLDILGQQFGHTTNSKGFKLLPRFLRVIQGDGISAESLPLILAKIIQSGWSIENLAFGMGGALLQLLNRDTQCCAMKCSSARIDGQDVDVFKEPKTDSGKKSKRGRLALQRDDQGCFVTRERGEGDPKDDLLVTVFENGELLQDWTLEQIRANAEIDLVRNSQQ